jgi:hypothetical protein
MLSYKILIQQYLFSLILLIINICTSYIKRYKSYSLVYSINYTIIEVVEIATIHILE